MNRLSFSFFCSFSFFSCARGTAYDDSECEPLSLFLFLFLTLSLSISLSLPLSLAPNHARTSRYSGGSAFTEAEERCGDHRCRGKRSHSVERRKWKQWASNSYCNGDRYDVERYENE